MVVTSPHVPPRGDSLGVYECPCRCLGVFCLCACVFLCACCVCLLTRASVCLLLVTSMVGIYYDEPEAENVDKSKCRFAIGIVMKPEDKPLEVWNLVSPVKNSSLREKAHTSFFQETRACSSVILVVVVVVVVVVIVCWVRLRTPVDTSSR